MNGSINGRVCKGFGVRVCEGLCFVAFEVVQ